MARHTRTACPAIYPLNLRRLAILQAVVAAPGIHTNDLDEVTGWSWCGGELMWMRQRKLIVYYGGLGRWLATEKGKIVLAVCLGKLARQRIACKAA